MLLAYAADLALDGARGLILAFALERRRANDEALVLDRLDDLFRRRRREPTKQRTEKRHCRPLALFADAFQITPGAQPRKAYQRGETTHSGCQPRPPK